VPAMAVSNIRLNQKLHSDIALDRRRIEKPATAAETAIDLLKSDDVSAELADHLDYAIGPGNAIDTPAFVDVIRCNLHGNLTLSAFKYGASTAAPPRPEASP
jgi:hypothetical protein